MPRTTPAEVLRLQEPVARTAIRPTEVPALTLLAGTTTRTRSPVRRPPTTLVALGFLSGNPNALVRRIWRLCARWRGSPGDAPPPPAAAVGCSPPHRPHPASGSWAAYAACDS